VRDWVSKPFTSWKIKKILKGHAHILGSHGTCLHTAFFTAIHLGFKEINIIAAGHGFYTSELEYFSLVADIDQEMRPGGPLFSNPLYAFPAIEQTFYLVECCRELGIQVNWYRNYTDGTLETVAIDDKWIRERKRVVNSMREKLSFTRLVGRLFIKAPFNFILSHS
jgi:hypothetical protein